MPSISTVEKFIAQVEANNHDKAIANFYSENASIQENNEAPRKGRTLLIKNEKKILAKTMAMSSKCIRPYFIENNRVIICWKFCFKWLDGTSTHIEELAYQIWENERVISKQFFYDPKQREKH
ncbi:nuclear transport factor 2 family protein [uncultured Psychroserpens sp.]|uniref:nuclear transport factor 2 family protein n=1 Tax=uncultured Psychroserpens sp. TaxID=255436 RepID=UPI002615D2B0|nr:nuclear transport factor 2 family protein [uncultured Psychroserpens sp.]